MIVGTITFISLMINFIVVLIVLAKINRQIDQIYKSLLFIEKKLKEEDFFVIKTNQTVERIEREIKDIEGEVDWKG